MATIEFQAVSEPSPGPKWQALFAQAWPAYEAWFLTEGDARRPSYADSIRALRHHMPELWPTYQQLVELAGGGDRQARLLSLYCPAPFLSGCSQAVWPGPQPLLARNYDYAPPLCEGVVLRSAWNGRAVIAALDCMWGVLDGINQDGLAVSLSFGGRTVVGQGFGIPLVLRYVLETCASAAEAIAVLERIPVHMAYNVTVLDAAGAFATIYVSPDRPPRVRRWPVATNHQGPIEWKEHAAATRTLEREAFLSRQLSDPDETGEALAQKFLEPPLFQDDYASGWGTLYTAIYRPEAREAEYRWRGASWRQSIDEFRETRLLVEYEG